MGEVAQEALAGPHDVSILGLFLEAGIIVQAVMLGLLLASVWTWAIVFDKLGTFARARRRAAAFEDAFWSGTSLEELYQDEAEGDAKGPAAIFVAAMREWKKSHEKGARSPIGLQTRIDKAMDVALSRETERMESKLGSLATIGSAAPFVGLFGTVIGIMTSFQAIAGSKSTNLAVVAPGIAEALLATAIGLLAAIPAVIAYNKLTADANRIAAKLEGFADEFGSILSRQVDEREASRQAPRPQAPTYQQAAPAPRPAPEPQPQPQAAPQPHYAQPMQQPVPQGYAQPNYLPQQPQHAPQPGAPRPAVLHQSSADPSFGY